MTNAKRLPDFVFSSEPKMSIATNLRGPSGETVVVVLDPLNVVGSPYILGTFYLGKDVFAHMWSVVQLAHVVVRSSLIQESGQHRHRA